MTDICEYLSSGGLGWLRTSLFCNLKRYLKNSKKLFRKVLSFPTKYSKKNGGLEIQLFIRGRRAFLDTGPIGQSFFHVKHIIDII
jgi:hypothetical protein